MTDTPETDGEWNRLACQDHPEFERNLADFARKLERKSNEIRAQLREEQQLHVQTLNERDEAREIAAELRDLVPWSESEPWNFSWENETSPSVDATEMKS